MQRIRAIVDFKLIFHAIESELTASNAVGVATGDFAHARAIADILRGIGITQSHISHIPLAVRHHDRENASAESR